jgi:hypothetical protein
MSQLPETPEAFSQAVLDLIRARHPGRTVELAATLVVTIDGRHLGLENLWRTVHRAPDAWLETVEHHVDRVLEGDQLASLDIPFAVAKSRIMPRIQPGSIFRTLDREQVAHVPWVNDTVIVFVIDMPHYTVSIGTEQMIRWGMGPEDLEDIARANLARYAPNLDVQVIRSNEGGRAAIISMHDGYDAARLLLGDLHERLSAQLGRTFYVAAPARDMFLAMTGDPEPFVSRLRARAEQEYMRLPYPICSDLFLVTPDGVAGTRAEAA